MDYSVPIALLELLAAKLREEQHSSFGGYRQAEGDARCAVEGAISALRMIPRTPTV